MNCATKVRVVDSPLGVLTLWGTDEALTGLSMDDQRHLRRAGEDRISDRRAFGEVAAQLDDYFAGALTEFDVPLCPGGTAFQTKVWTALLEIPYGETRSYGEVAAAIGRPTAWRAVGLANGRNPIAIIVPCHRVIGSNGTLTGYGGGLDRKRLLLDLERTRNGSS